MFVKYFDQTAKDGMASVKVRSVRGNSDGSEKKSIRYDLNTRQAGKMIDVKRGN